MDRMVEATPTVISRGGSVRKPATLEEHEDCEAHYQALVDDGFKAERQRDGSVLFPDDGSFHPLARTRLLAIRAREEGAVLVENMSVTDLQSLEADRVIV